MARSINDYWYRCIPRALHAKRISGKTDAEIAALMDVRNIDRRAGRAQVNHWFRGKRQPTINQFFLLCKVLGADPQYILFDGPDKKERQRKPKQVDVAE